MAWGSEGREDLTNFTEDEILKRGHRMILVKTRIGPDKKSPWDEQWIQKCKDGGWDTKDNGHWNTVKEAGDAINRSLMAKYKAR